MQRNQPAQQTERATAHERNPVVKIRPRLVLLMGTTILLLSCYAPRRMEQPAPQASQRAPEPFSAARYDAEILGYLNELRRDPPAFYKKYVRAYIAEKRERFTARYTASLQHTLSRLGPLPAFSMDPTINRLAGKQLHYLVVQLKGARLSHDQGRISFADRIKGTGLHCFAENLYRFPKSSPLEVVLDLLIDQGVSSLGHRKNMLNPKYTRIGIQSAVAPNGYKVTVMDFGCTPAS